METQQSLFEPPKDAILSRIHAFKLAQANAEETQYNFYGKKIRPMTGNKVNQKLRNIFIIKSRKEELLKLTNIQQEINKCQYTSMNTNYQLFGKGIAERTSKDCSREIKAMNISSIPSLSNINCNKPFKIHSIQKGFRINNKSNIKTSNNRGASYDVKDKIHLAISSQRSYQSKKLSKKTPECSFLISSEHKCKPEQPKYDLRKASEILVEKIPDVSLCIGSTVHSSCSVFLKNIIMRYNKKILNKSENLEHPIQILNN